MKVLVRGMKVKVRGKKLKVKGKKISGTGRNTDQFCCRRTRQRTGTLKPPDTKLGPASRTCLETRGITRDLFKCFGKRCSMELQNISFERVLARAQVEAILRAHQRLEIKQVMVQGGGHFLAI